MEGNLRAHYVFTRTFSPPHLKIDLKLDFWPGKWTDRREIDFSTISRQYIDRRKRLGRVIKPLSYTILLEGVLGIKKCRQKHSELYDSVDFQF